MFFSLTDGAGRLTDHRPKEPVDDHLALAVSTPASWSTRSLRRSFRDPEAFFTALMLPVILLLLFVYVFGGAMAPAASTSTTSCPG